MTYHWTIPLLAAAMNALLAAVVLRQNSRLAVNRLFGLLSLSLVLWNLNIFVLYYVDHAETAYYWSNLFRVGTLLAAPVAAHLFGALSESRSRSVWMLISASYALALALVAINAFGSLAVGVRHYEWGFYPIGTTLYLLVPIGRWVPYAALLDRPAWLSERDAEDATVEIFKRLLA